MELCYAVYIGAGICSESCHMNNVAVDNAHLSLLVLGNALSGELFLALVGDERDDVVDYGDNLVHQVCRPLLESLAENGVVGVGAGLSRDFESLVKGHALDLEKSYELGNAGYGVSIVELDSVLFCEEAEIIAVLSLVAADNILQRSGAEEVLLLESEHLALVLVVVGIENLGDILGVVLLLDSEVVLGVVERGEVEVVDSLSLPQTEGVDVVGLAADYSHIVGNCLYGLILERYGDGLVLLADAPRILKALPVVGNLYLIAVLDELLEQAVLIADSVTVEGYLMGSG